MPLKILLADDSMTAQNMAKKILSEAGYEVTTVSNGAAALKKIADRTPDLVILDIYMPGYTGLEVCERVKRAAVTSRMPVLLSVGKLEPYREQDATAVRADGVIVKPFEATELVTIVTNVILRASGDTIDAATRPPTPSVAVQAIPAVEPETLLATEPLDHLPELASPESQAQDIGPAITYGPTTVSNGEYLDTSLPPVEEKPLTMAAPAAPTPAVPPAPVSFATPGFRVAEADSSMPFMIDQLLKADENEKPAEEDSFHRYSGPVLDVSPVAQGTEEIETIEIPAPEPSVGTVPFSDESVPAQATADSTAVSPVESTAVDVEAFLREHVAEAGPELVSATEIKFDHDAHDHESAWANAVWQDGSALGFNETVVVDVNAAQVPPDEKQAMPVELSPVEVPPESTQPEHAAPEIAESDSQPVIEVEPPTTSPSASAVEPELPPTLVSTSAMEAEPVAQEADIGESEAVQPDANARPAELVQEPSIGKSEGLQPDVHARPAGLVQEPAAQLDVEKTLIEPGITVGAEAESVFEAAQTPAAAAEVCVEPAPVAASSSPAMGSETQPPGNEVPNEDFMFSVPMMLEATAAMSLPELPDLGPQATSEFAASSTFVAPKYAAEAVRPAALDEAAIAGAVQRVMERFKPQIVAEIVRELAKHRQ